MTSLHSLHYKDLFQKNFQLSPLKLTVSSETKVSILSDCHLGKMFDKNQFLQLKSIILSADQIVINGDFWFNEKTSFNEFMDSPWAALFPLLKRKNAIYLFGNHDMPAFSDERILLFCNQAGFQLKLTAGTVKLHVEHGHLLVSNAVKKILRMFENKPKLFGKITSPFEIVNEIGLKHFNRKRGRLTRVMNLGYKKKRLTVSSEDEYFVMGHTHVLELDEKRKYINLGRTHNGDFSYLTIYQNNAELIVL